MESYTESHLYYCYYGYNYDDDDYYDYYDYDPCADRRGPTIGA